MKSMMPYGITGLERVMKPLQVLCSMWPEEKCVINIMEPAQWFVVSLCPHLIVFHKEVTDDRGDGEPIATPAFCL